MKIGLAIENADNNAPITRGILASTASGIAIGIVIEKIPLLEPVANTKKPLLKRLQQENSPRS